MERNSKLYQEYLNILIDELKPAMGCTEPIAIAYASAKAKSVLVNPPTSIKIEVGGNILKNVKSVIVPNTGGLKGIKAAVAAGILYGDPNKELEVISSNSDSNSKEIYNYVEKTPIEVSSSPDLRNFDINIYLYNDKESSNVRIVDTHTNIVLVKHNDEVIFEKKIEEEVKNKVQLRDKTYESLTVEGILDFAKSVYIEDIKTTLDRQIKYNMSISHEGLKNNYGANIGKVLLQEGPQCIKTKAKAYSAAACDARMGGCALPVVINSGSGNQGIASSIPVIVYARSLNKTNEETYRSLVVSNLVTIHLKSGIGTLSAYCGAISAGVGAGAGIAYLYTKDPVSVSHTIVNALAVLSGTVCDGAKASCALKVAYAVDAGIFGYEMYKNGNEFYGGDGLVTEGVENTIKNIDILASEGMCEADRKIIDIMVNNK